MNINFRGHKLSQIEDSRIFCGTNFADADEDLTKIREIRKSFYSRKFVRLK